MRQEAAALLRLAWPIALANVGWMMLGTVDTIMLGWLSTDALAAAINGNAWVTLTSIAAMGVVMGMDPIVTQSHGARDRERLGRALQRGLLLAALLALPTVLSRWWTADVLHAFRGLAEHLGGPQAAARFRPELAADSQRYAVAQAFGEPFFLAFIAQRQQLQGRGIVRPVLVVTLVAIALNAALNWLLIFRLGHGLVGAGVATGFTRAFLALGLWAAIHRLRLLRGAWVPWSRASFRGLGELLRHGLPTGALFALEVGAFNATLLLASLLGVVANAAHGIAVNVASNTFMLPLGVSIAAVTRVGNLIGAGRQAAARRAAWVAIGLGAATMACAALLLLALRHGLAELYSDDAAVIAATAAVLPIAAAFQVFDGVQVVAGGVLRGTGRTVAPALFNLVAWYVVGLPLAWRWAITSQHGLAGVWWALAVGLASVALLLVAWVGRYGARGAPV